MKGLGKDKIVQQAPFNTNYQLKSALSKFGTLTLNTVIFLPNMYLNLCQVCRTMPGVTSIQNSSQKNSQHLLQKYKSTLTFVILH